MDGQWLFQRIKSLPNVIKPDLGHVKAVVHSDQCCSNRSVIKFLECILNYCASYARLIVCIRSAAGEE